MRQLALVWITCLAGAAVTAAAGAAGDVAAAGDVEGLRAPTNLVPLRTLGGREGGLEFRRPAAVVTTPHPGVLVADAGNSRVVHLDLDDGFLWEAGGLGTGEGYVGRPTAVATVSSLSYLVLDALARRVLEFHARGEYRGVALDLTRPDLRDRLGDVDPRGITVDREGNTIISDRDGDRLLVFSSVWDFLYEIGGFGDDAQSFADPEGLAVGRQRLYVADSMNGRVQVLDLLGGFIDSWELPGGGLPLAVAVDGDGNVYTADAGSDRVVVFTPDGKVACQIGAHGRGPGSFRRPSGLCIAGELLVVADADNDRLQIFRIQRTSL